MSITPPKQNQRIHAPFRYFGSAGSGRGLSSRLPGALLGEETHSLSVQELPFHKHNTRIQIRANQNNDWREYGNGTSLRASNSSNIANSNNNIALEGTNFPSFDGSHYYGEWKQVEDYVGSSWSFTQYQPTSFLNAMIKL